MKELVLRYESLVKELNSVANEFKGYELNPYQLAYLNNINNQLKTSLNIKAFTRSDIKEDEVCGVWHSMLKDYDVRLRTNKITPNGVYDDIKNKIF